MMLQILMMLQARNLFVFLTQEAEPVSRSGIKCAVSCPCRHRRCRPHAFACRGRCPRHDPFKQSNSHRHISQAAKPFA